MDHKKENTLGKYVFQKTFVFVRMKLLKHIFSKEYYYMCWLRCFLAKF